MVPTPSHSTSPTQPYHTSPAPHAPLLTTPQPAPQVRIIVGTLVQVGLGRLSSADFDAVLEATDRAYAGPTAPAHGLCLEHVEYAS